jgi:hypothetical protein
MLSEFGLSRIAGLLGRRGAEPRSATGEAVSVGGFVDQTGGGHGGEALVERGGADAAGRAQFGERPGLVAACKGRGDALIEGVWFDTMLGLTLGLHRLEGECLIALDQFKCHPRHGGGGPVLDGQDDAIVTVAPKIEVGIAPGVGSEMPHIRLMSAC